MWVYPIGLPHGAWNPPENWRVFSDLFLPGDALEAPALEHGTIRTKAQTHQELRHGHQRLLGARRAGEVKNGGTMWHPWTWCNLETWNGETPWVANVSKAIRKIHVFQTCFDGKNITHGKFGDGLLVLHQHYRTWVGFLGSCKWFDPPSPLRQTSANASLAGSRKLMRMSAEVFGCWW